MSETPEASRSIETAPTRPERAPGRGPLLILVASAAIAVWLVSGHHSIEVVFDFVAHFFYEIPQLGRIRRDSQISLFRYHLLVASLISVGYAAISMSRTRTGEARRLLAVFLVAYVLRATVWIVGGNLPLVPGDSCHYIEVASSIVRGEGPVKHYVESFFIDYPAIRRGAGVLDDWATPLYSQALAVAYRLTGVEPGRELRETVGVAKGVSFLLNLMCLPALYLCARRMHGPRVAFGAAVFLAILPVHVIYAGFVLRESLVALTSILAVWFFLELRRAVGAKTWCWAIAAGLAGGAAILSRNTAMAVVGVCGLYALATGRLRSIPRLAAWTVVVLAVIAPWASATYREYGEPFYTYTKFFQYTFSWTVHHYQSGKPSASSFYTWANAPEILRVKIKSLAIIVTYTSMIFGVPALFAYLRRLASRGSAGVDSGARDADRLTAWLTVGFVLATLVNIADVTQVEQLGRYYLPLFILWIPTAVAGALDAAEEFAIPERAAKAAAPFLFLLLWAAPTWAYDAGWLVKPYQLHWPALEAAGRWVREHPEAAPADARIMTWFPWEFRIASDRTTVLLPRSFQAPRIEEVIRQYGVTHVLWGSFEPPSDVDPESFGPYLQQVRISLGLTDSREIYRSPRELLYPVRLYRIRGGGR